jgi:DnaJ family protein A protein 2
MNFRKFSSFVKTTTPLTLTHSKTSVSFQKSSYSKKKEENFYEVLGVARDSSEQDIRKAYKALAMKYHPDRNPDGAEKFKAIAHAYSVLSDAQKRQTYDMYGEEGVSGSGHQYANPEDIFSQMFGGGFNPFGGGQQRRPGPKKPKPITHQVIVSMEDLYNGTRKKFQIKRDITCTTCHGNGAKVGSSSNKCTTCRGQGVTVEARQVGGGAFMQFQQVCPSCKGEGEVIKEGDKCGTCNGKKITSENVMMEVDIEKGMHGDQALVYGGQGDQRPGAPRGDLIFQIHEKPHPYFTRKGDNLVYKHTLSLREALCGYSFDIAHLDNRILRVQSDPGEIIQPGSVKKVPKMGMPKHESSLYGDLYIEFDIVFPKRNSIPSNDLTNLSALLPNFPESKPIVETVPFTKATTLDVSKDEFSRVSKVQKKKQRQVDEDEDEGQGQPQCQQQ